MALYLTVKKITRHLWEFHNLFFFVFITQAFRSKLKGLFGEFIKSEYIFSAPVMGQGRGDRGDTPSFDLV
jgi:hypothetical protein